MTPQKVRVYWASKEFKGQTEATEPYYGTQYSLAAVPDDWLALWRDTVTQCEGLHLPAANPFIPTNFDLHATDASSPPQLVLDTSSMRLFHSLDTSFERPKAVVYLDFQVSLLDRCPVRCTQQCLMFG